MTPIDTVREALERVEDRLEYDPCPCSVAARFELARRGRDLLEDMEECGWTESYTNPAGTAYRWCDLAKKQAQSYARRVGEVVDAL